MKGEFLSVKKLRAMSGFGWDDAKGVVTAAQDVWDKLLKVIYSAHCLNV
jgi:hypothetical protein